MKHLDIVAAVDLAEGGEDPDRQHHLQECGRCRRLVASLQRTLVALEHAGRSTSELPPGLQRWAQAYARVAGQAKERVRVLGFLAGGAHRLAAVRSGLEHSQAMLYGDHELHIDLRVEARGEEGVRIHGQVVPVGQTVSGEWKLSVVDPAGAHHSTISDADGEFWIDGLRASSGWTLLAERGGQRFLVPRFGTEDGGSDEQ